MDGLLAQLSSGATWLMDAHSQLHALLADTKDAADNKKVKDFVASTFVQPIMTRIKRLAGNLLPEGVITAMGVLRYLFEAASPFLLVAEIELSLRMLINLALEGDELGHFASTSLSHYKPESMPATLEDMTFNDYILLIGHSTNGLSIIVVSLFDIYSESEML